MGELRSPFCPSFRDTAVGSLPLPLLYWVCPHSGIGFQWTGRTPMNSWWRQLTNVLSIFYGSRYPNLAVSFILIIKKNLILFNPSSSHYCAVPSQAGWNIYRRSAFSNSNSVHLILNLHIYSTLLVIELSTSFVWLMIMHHTVSYTRAGSFSQGGR